MSAHSHASAELAAGKGSDGAHSQPLIDVVKLHQRIGRNADLIRDLVSLFLSTQPKDIKSLRRSVEATDVARSKKLAHRIAGAFASLAAEAPAARGLAIERLAAAGKFDICLIEVAELEQQFEKVRQEFSALLSQQ